MTDVDVIVAGGGPAGAAAALVLARAGRRVLLAAPDVDGTARFGEELPPAARPLLRELGVLDAIERDGHLVSHGTASAWGSADLVARDFVFDPHGPALLLDRARFDARLREAARAAGAALVAARVRVVESHAAQHTVELGAARATCRWLVDATGRTASLARQLGARRTADDRLVAYLLLATPGPDAAPLPARLLVESEPDGWWYAAPTPSGARVIALLTDHRLPAHARNAAGLAPRLARTTHARLAAHGCALSDGRATDAATRTLSPATGPGWLAVGDAALALDPLSSQGIFHALYTGLRGAEAVDAALANDVRPLAAYAARLAEIRAAFLANRAATYAAEPRWRDRRFWQRR